MQSEIHSDNKMRSRYEFSVWIGDEEFTAELLPPNRNEIQHDTPHWLVIPSVLLRTCFTNLSDRFRVEIAQASGMAEVIRLFVVHLQTRERRVEGQRGEGA